VTSGYIIKNEGQLLGGIRIYKDILQGTDVKGMSDIDGAVEHCATGHKILITEGTTLNVMDWGQFHLLEALDSVNPKMQMVVIFVRDADEDHWKDRPIYCQRVSSMKTSFENYQVTFDLSKMQKIDFNGLKQLLNSWWKNGVLAC
jgi:hypothetical protein